MDNLDPAQLKDKLVRQYDIFSDKAHGIFAASREKSKEALHDAIEKTREQMTALGELSVEQGKRFQYYMQRDLDQTSRDVHKLGAEAKDSLNPARLGAGAMDSIAALLHVGSDALLQISIKADEAITYKAGELTSAGTLTCSKCGHVKDFSKTSLISACTACQNDTFRKSY